MPTVKVKGSFPVEDLPIIPMAVLECFFAIMFFTCRSAGVFLAEVGFGLIWFFLTVFIWLKAQFCVTGVIVTRHYIVLKHGHEIKHQIPLAEVRSVEVGKTGKVSIKGSKKNYSVGKMRQAIAFERMINKMLEE
ncbi:MAG: hypothetical protein K5668_11270 [Lachnospiraceae bacterium]|nr:hypothetical protein [Lachnospiraceae bacterium]